MKSLTIHTLVVAMALALCGTPSMAATELSGQPLSQSEKHATSATAATYSAPLYAVSRLEAQTFADQEMTDQELKAVEGGYAANVYIIDMSFLGTYEIVIYYPQPGVSVGHIY
jgi:hypothetical protein